MAWRLLVLATLLQAALGGHAGQLYVVSVGSGAESGKLHRLTNDDNYDYGSPDWSPDGSQIVFDLWPAGPNYRKSDIAIVDSRGGPTEKIAPGATPSWSPDGRQLVYRTYGAISQIVVMNADGSGREAMYNHWGCPCWSPIGTEIFMTYEGGIARFDLATGKLKVMLDDYRVRFGFGISPNSQHFCVSNTRGGLGIASFDKTLDRWKVTERLPSSYLTGHTSWSPDGKRVVLVLRKDGPFEALAVDPDRNSLWRIYVLTVDDGSPPVEVLGVPAHWDCYDADWSPDGKWIAFVRAGSDRDSNYRATSYGAADVPERQPHQRTDSLGVTVSFRKKL